MGGISSEINLKTKKWGGRTLIFSGEIQIKFSQTKEKGCEFDQFVFEFKFSQYFRVLFKPKNVILVLLKTKNLKICELYHIFMPVVCVIKIFIFLKCERDML